MKSDVWSPDKPWQWHQEGLQQKKQVWEQLQPAHRKNMSHFHCFSIIISKDANFCLSTIWIFFILGPIYPLHYHATSVYVNQILFM